MSPPSQARVLPKPRYQSRGVWGAWLTLVGLLITLALGALVAVGVLALEVAGEWGLYAAAVTQLVGGALAYVGRVNGGEAPRPVR
jgi:hypothetical protein